MQVLQVTLCPAKWRQQFDWAVVEWNRDNVFEHPALRNLPDGDLSGLALSYQEQRINCIPLDSNLYPIVAWDQLRLWIPNADGSDTVYYVRLVDHATPIEGSYLSASATMTLVANPGAGQRVGLAFLEEHYYYAVQTGNQLTDIAAEWPTPSTRSVSCLVLYRTQHLLLCPGFQQT